MLDPENCAMAFRILRMNGNDVSSGNLLVRPKETLFPAIGLVFNTLIICSLE